MSTGAAIVIVGGIGVAAFLYVRSQQQQQQALAAAQAAQGAGQGGGISGLATRAFQSWEHDPLGIANTKQALGYARTALTSAASGLASGANDVVGFVKGLF